MVSFGYLKLTFDISTALNVAYECVHVHASTMLFCVDVLITQYNTFKTVRLSDHFTKDCFGPDSTRSFLWSIGSIL